MRLSILLYKKEFVAEILRTLFIVTFPLFCLVVVLHFFGQCGWRGAFMWDDNSRQWSSVIDAGLHQFFHGGGMPFYIFFNYGGFEIYDEGYYGLYNPLMWVAFLFARLMRAETISLYIYIVILFGNMVLYRMAKETKLSYIGISLVIFAYTFTPVFYNNANRWYYVLNSYLIIPLIIYSFLTWYKKTYFQNIFVVAFIFVLSVSGGNCQYSFMHFISWGILALVLIKKKNKSFKVLFLGVLVGLALSTPFIFGLFEASSRGRIFSTDFFSQSIHPLRYLIFSFLPNTAFFKKLFYLVFFPKNSMDSYTEYCIQYLFTAFFCILTVIFLYAYKTGKKSKNETTEIAFYSIIAYLFWLLFMGGEQFLIASLIFHLPLVNNFQHLFKAMYVMPAFLLLPAIIGLNHIFNYSSTKRIIKISVICFLLILLFGQICETVQIIKSTGGTRTSNHTYLKNIKELDSKNYRCIFLSENEESYWILDPIPYSNANISARLQSIGGYETSRGTIPDSMRVLYANIGWGALDWANGIKEKELIEFFDSEEQNLRLFVNALKDNSVKYILTRVSDLHVFRARILLMGMDSKEIYRDDQNRVYVYELSDIPSIAKDNLGNMLDIEEFQLDKMKIKLGDNAVQKVYLSERFNQKLRAYLVSPVGKKQRLALSQSDSGFVEIQISQSQSLQSYVLIRYENKIYSIGVFITAIILFMSIVFFIKMLFSENKTDLEEK